MFARWRARPAWGMSCRTNGWSDRRPNARRAVGSGSHALPPSVQDVRFLKPSFRFSADAERLASRMI